MSPLATFLTVPMSFGITSLSDFNIPVLWKDSSISHISKWHTKAGYFGNWCLLQKQPGICSRASSSQQKPFHRHEWELEHALCAYCSRQSLCCPLRRGANETLDLSFSSLVEHNKRKTFPLKKKTNKTLSFLKCYRFLGKQLKKKYKTSMLVMQDQKL